VYGLMSCCLLQHTLHFPFTCTFTLSLPCTNWSKCHYIGLHGTDTNRNLVRTLNCSLTRNVFYKARQISNLHFYAWNKINYLKVSWDSSVGIATDYWLDDREIGVESRRGLGIFLLTIASRPVLGPTQPPIEWVTGVISLATKRPGREADTHLHLVQTIRMGGAISPFPQCVFMAWYVVKYRVNFTFTLQG
jgi:hypothetical protein